MPEARTTTGPGQKLIPALIKFQRLVSRARIGEHEQDEIRIEYLEAGDPDQPTIVYLHGFGDVKDSFILNAMRLSRQYHVVIPDIPGFGGSCKSPHLTYNLDNYGRWLAAFLRDLNAGPVHLLGNSLGGGCALATALECPDLLRSLTVIDPAGIVDPAVYSIYHQITSGRNLFMVHNRFEYDNFLNHVFFRRPPWPAMIYDYYFELFRENRSWHGKLIGDLLNNMAEIDDDAVAWSLNERVREITIPTLILWGDRDRLFPVALADTLHQAIPGSRLHIFPDTGHSVQIEAPGRFLKVYRPFLDTFA